MGIIKDSKKINPIVKDSKKINPIISENEARNTKLTLQSTDGKTFGEISLSAYNAIKGGRVDSYTPVDSAEKKVIDDFIGYANEKANSPEAKQERIDSNPVFKRYNIDPNDFDYDDLSKWASDHGYTMHLSGSGHSYFAPEYEGGFLRNSINAIFFPDRLGKKLTTDQEDADLEVLTHLAANNERKDLSNKDFGALASAVFGVSDGLSFGAINAFADYSTKKQYEKAGLNPDDYVSLSDATSKTVGEHPVANVIGDIGGSLVSIGALGKAVGTATQGVKWISSAPEWVQAAINSGITFAVASGSETASAGGNLEEVLINSGINAVGGAVGGAISSKVGDIGLKLLFDKGLQNKVIPEMFRAGASSVAFAGGKTAATYFLYPEEYRPSAKQFAVDMGVAFGLGAISSLANTMKTTRESKKVLNELTKKIGDDYALLTMANSQVDSGNGAIVTNVDNLAKNVIQYTDAIESYLNGKGFKITVTKYSGETALTPYGGKTSGAVPTETLTQAAGARFVGQEGYVGRIIAETQAIRNNAYLILNRSISQNAQAQGSTNAATGSAVPTVTNSAVPAGRVDDISSIIKAPTVTAETGNSSATQFIPPVVSSPVVSTNGVATAGEVAVSPKAPVSSTNTGSVGKSEESSDMVSGVESGKVKFAPESASEDIKKLENVLDAKGIDEESRKKTVDTVLEIDSALSGSELTIREVLDDVTKITTSAVNEMEKYVGKTDAYWRIYCENINLVPQGYALEAEGFVPEYVNAFLSAMRKNSPERYGGVMVGEDGTDLAGFVADTVKDGRIPTNVKSARSYAESVSLLKSIIVKAEENIGEEREKIYSENADPSSAFPETIDNEKDSVPEQTDEKTTIAEPVSKPEPEQVKNEIDSTPANKSVAVGDAFKDTKTGNTISVVERDEENTTVHIDTGSKIEQRVFPNSQADTLATNEQYEHIEAPATTTEKRNISLTKIGDFYSAFNEDAVELADKLGLKVVETTRHGEPVKLVGFPVRYLDSYARKLGDGYNFTVEEQSNVTGVNPENVHVSTENTSETNTDVIKHTDEIEGLKLIDTEESTLVNGKTLITGIYELNSDKDFGRKSYKKEQFDIFCNSEPWIRTVDGTTYGHYGFTKSNSSGYVVTYLPVGLAVTKANTEKDAKLMLKTLEDNRPELPLSIRAFGDEYRCFGVSKELALDIKGVIDSATKKASAAIITEIQDGKVPFHTKAELVEYVKAHKGDSVRVTFDNGISEVRTLEGIGNTNLRTKKPDGSVSNAELKGVKYNDTGFSIDYSTGVSVTYDFVNVTETPKSTTESPESVIKKADSVTGTPENEKITVGMSDDVRAEAKDAEKIEKLSEDKKRSLATAENADALSSTPETTNSTASTDIVNISVRNDTENDTLNLTDKCELITTKHTATGNDIWVVTLKDRLTSEEYKDLSAKVKAVGGYYSRFAKTPDGKAIPGFVFKTEPTAKEIKVFNDFFGDTETEPISENIQKNDSQNGKTEHSVLNNQSESGIIEENTDKDGANNAESQSEVLDGQSESNGSGLRSGAFGTPNEEGTERADGQNRKDGGSGLQKSAGADADRSDVRDDGERIHGENDGRDAAGEAEGVTAGRGSGERVHAGGDRGIPEVHGEPERLIKDDGVEKTSKKGTVSSKKNNSNKDNFVITDAIASDIDNNPPSAEDNIRAIELLQTLENEGRSATAEEKRVLAKYKGWGGIDTRHLPFAITDKLYGFYGAQQLRAMQSSQNNAFFTPTGVIDAMYMGLRQMGFKGGNVLETSMGVGNFFGRMPPAISSRSSLTGIELESYTARIAQYLYPGATVINKPYQDVVIKNGSFDLVIGNVPFGQNKIGYGKKKYSLHNYFIISSLDKVCDGGIVAVITSAGTLDSHGIDARSAIMDRADVVACFKLPEKVFSRNANTGVQTDLLILRKRESGEKPVGDSILNTVTTPDGFHINEYFEKHPENILGTLAKGTNAWGEVTTVLDDGDFYEKLKTSMKALPSDLITGKTVLKPTETLISTSEKPRFFEKDGVLYSDDGAGTATAVPKNQAGTVRDYIAVRDAYKELLDAYASDAPEEETETLRTKLGSVYDKFRKQHGAITGDGKKKDGNETSTNNTFLDADSDYYLVSGLERYNAKNGKIEKSALFEKDTLRKKKIVSVNSSSDALLVSLNETGGINLARMQELTGKTESELISDLDGEIVFTPDGKYELTDIYLSGNIYEKLEAVKGKPEFKKQEEMLKKVIPMPKAASEITVKIGANYIDPKYISQFAHEVLNAYLTVRKDSSGRWVIEGVKQARYGSVINVKYGCEAFNAVQLLEKILNDGDITATKKIGSGKDAVTVFDAEMTDIAKQKADDIRAAFESWVFSDSDRRRDIVDKYNRLYNNYRTPDYSRIAEKLSLDSMSSTLKEKLYPHQKKGIARFLFGGNILFAHGVGTGKTFEMIASVMEARRMGIINKAAMVVPNNKVVDFKRDILEAYPDAKVLVIDTANKKRQTMLGLVNSNDWDIILMARTTFTKIPVSNELQTHYLAQQLEDIELQIADAQNDRNTSSRQIKNLIKQRDNYEQKLKDLNAQTKRDENSVEFEKLGIDCICVDEAHNYKSITTPSKLDIKGLVNKNSAQMANDMLMKLDYLRSIDGRIIFGTGTPITNTVSEIYNMIRMVRPDILESAGIRSLDEWVNTFAMIDTVTEIGVDNQIKSKSTQVIRSFVNSSEMVGMFRQFADVVFTEDVVKNLPKAVYRDIELEGTKEHVLIQKHISNALATAKPADKLRIFGQVMTMADAAAVDLRMLCGVNSEYNPLKDYSPEELDLPGSKINVMCDNVLSEYKASSGIKGTQIIFCDTGAGSGTVYSFNLHKDIMQKLVERGIPENEIVIIKSQTDAQLEQLYAKVNSGEVRVLIGTSQKMAEGLNVQQRVVAIHHPTVTYKPSDKEQSDARGVRAGNINKEVHIYRYLQNNTFDSHKWQAQDRKGAMIKSALKGDAINELDDIGADEEGGAGVDAATAMAITSGNPLVKEKIDVDKEVTRLKTLQRNYLTEHYGYQDTIAKNPELIREFTEYAGRLKNDIARRDEHGDKPVLSISGVSYEKQSDANKALANAIKSAPKNGKYVKVGEIGGFDVMFKGDTGGMDYALMLKGTNAYSVEYGEGNIVARITGVLNRLDKELSGVLQRIESLKSDLEIAEKEVKKPFEKEAELNDALERQKDVSYRFEHFNDKKAGANGDNEKDDEKGIDKSSPMLYNKNRGVHLSKDGNWHTDLNREEFNSLIAKIRLVAKHNKRHITNTADWILCEISSRSHPDGRTVFAIYSTADVDNPTVLYESSGQQAIKEEEYLREYFEEKQNDKVIRGQQDDINTILSGDRLQRGANAEYSSQRLVAGRTGGTNRGLQKKASFKPRGAFNRVLENLFEIQERDRLSSGDAEQRGDDTGGSAGGEKYSLTEKKSDTELKPERAAASSSEGGQPDVENRWHTEPLSENKNTGVTLADIVKDISEKFGIPISTGKVTVRNASGVYKEKPEAIRTRIENNLPTISHELGHHLDKIYDLSSLSSVKSLRTDELRDFLEQYPAEERPAEAVAEFVRIYLKNMNEANRLFPEFYSDFIRKLSEDDLRALNGIASAVNEYLSYGIDERYEAAIVSSREKDKTPFRERWKGLISKIYTDWVDAFHPQEKAMDYVEEVNESKARGGKNAYILATNSLNAHARAQYLVCEGFCDLDGNVVPGAKSFIDSIAMVDAKNLKLLDKYLVLKHSLEWIAPEQEDVSVKRVFADDMLEDVNTINAKIAEIEKEHPEIVTAADNLYEYQNNIITHFVIPAGGMTSKDMETLNRKYPHYVPFYRAVENGNGSNARGTFANQESPIRRAKGSGALIISPVESIIRNTEKMVKFAMRNRVMQVWAEYADTVDGFGKFMEKVPPDMIPHSASVLKQKEQFTDALQSIVSTEDEIFAISGLLDDIFGDSVTEFSPVASAKKKIVTVLRRGKPTYYQIHDDEFYSSIAELSPAQMSGAMKFINSVMQTMKLLITQNNPIFAVTNAMRDIGTAYKLSETNNVAAFATLYIKALMGVITNSDDYKQYKALGGGHPSELSANIESISQMLRKVALKDMGVARRLAYAIFIHPVETVAMINDAVESIPRFMEFLRTLNAGGDLQDAIYNANDITTNFKRSGKGAAAKFLNKVILFNNASIQGTDKTARTVIKADGKRRFKVMLKWVLHALLLGIIGYLYNKEVDEEGYKNLSSYKKNNFYNIAIGDGKFISLPKPRENAILDSLAERTIEFVAGENGDAFYGFLEYIASQLLPPMFPETLGLVGAAHDVLGGTAIGGLIDIGFNEDFKGSPIESGYDKNLPSNERYTENTSKLAYSLGQTWGAVVADMSPKKIDHLLSSYTGILGQINRALFPISDSRRDYSLGLRNKFVSDSNYSTDVLNKLYENEEMAEKKFRYYGTVSTAVEYEKNAVITSYISGMNKAIKALPEDEQRDGRAYLLRRLNAWEYDDTVSQSKMLDALDGVTVSTDAIITELPSSVLEWTVDKQKYTYQMTPQEYDRYISDYLTVVENARKHYGTGTIESYENAKKAAKDYMSEYKKSILKEKYFKNAVKKAG